MILSDSGQWVTLLRFEWEWGGLVIGVLFGFALHLVYGGNNPVIKTSVAWFNIVGNGYVRLLQMIVMQLVFVSILNSVAKLHIIIRKNQRTNTGYPAVNHPDRSADRR